MVNLGMISRLTKIDIKFWVENLSQEAMHWIVVEITYDPLKKKFYEVLERIEPFRGVLENYHDRVCFSYKIKTNVNSFIHLLSYSLCLLLYFRKLLCGLPF